jgi:hypothetical protein
MNDREQEKKMTREKKKVQRTQRKWRGRAEKHVDGRKRREKEENRLEQ